MTKITNINKKWLFEILSVGTFFSKVSKKWQTNVFCVFFVFFQENMSSIHWENRFRKVPEIIQMPSFWVFQSDQVINLQCFDGHSLLRFRVFDKIVFFIPIGMLIVFSYLFFIKNTKKRVVSSILTRFFSKFLQFPRKLIPVHLLKSFWHPNPKAFGKIPINFLISLEATSRAINQLIIKNHKKNS